MIDLPLNDDQRRLEHAVREWAARDVAPYIADVDQPADAARAAVRQGLRQFLMAGADYVALGILCEELEYFDKSLRAVLTEECVAAADGESADELRRFTEAAGAAGLIRASRDASVNYIRERTALPAAPQLIAGMESDYQVARALWRKCAELKMSGQPCAREADLAHCFATAAAARAAADAVRIHGANGYSNAYPVGRYHRNCQSSDDLRAACEPQIKPIPLRPRWNLTSH